MTDKRIAWGLGSIIVLAALGSVSCGSTSSSTASAAAPSPVLFEEHDKLILFSGPDQNGVITGLLVGSVDGTINGAGITNFRMFLTGPTTFNFDFRTGITDADGDQMMYRATGSGRFVCPPLADSTSPPLPGPPQGIFGLGGPLSGTAAITAASASSSLCPNCGKFTSLVGQSFTWRTVSYNPGNGCDPAQQFGLGTMFVQLLR